jgi:tetratricopeptide (TPR) repeat protein
MYHAKKDNEVALKCLKKSLSIRLSQLGDTDLSVADSYGWVGKIHREKKAFSKAVECFVCAHSIKVKVLGKAHIGSAEVLQNIGILYDDLGLHSQR